MSKSCKSSQQTDNEPNNKSKKSIERALNEVKEQTKEVVDDHLKDGQSKLNQTHENAKRVKSSRDFERGFEKNPSVAKAVLPDTERSNSTPTLVGKNDDQFEKGKEISGISNALNSTCNVLDVPKTENGEQLLMSGNYSGETRESNTFKKEKNSGDATLSQADCKTHINGGTGNSDQIQADAQSGKSKDSTRWGKKPIVNMIRSWFTGAASHQASENELQSSTDDNSECVTPDVQLIELPEIPRQYRPREINGFGILSKSQSLPMKTKRQYQNLLNTGVTCTLQFCKNLEVMNEKSKKQDIKKAFALQFTRTHSELMFTEADLKTNDEVNTELLLQLKILFNDLVSSNHIIWIVNKFEYDDFGRKFRKTIAEVLRNEFQYDVSYKRDDFYRHVVAASLLQWRKSIPFP